MSKPSVTQKKLIYQGFCDFRLDTICHGKHNSIYNILVSKHDAVGILGKTSDGKYLITKEYRYPVEKTLLGLPGGLVEPGESFLKAAEREFLEETGYVAQSFQLLASSYPLPALCTQKIYFVLATDIKKKQSQELDVFEEISFSLLSKEELKKNMEKMDVDSVCLTALQLEKFFQ